MITDHEKSKLMIYLQNANKHIDDGNKSEYQKGIAMGVALAMWNIGEFSRRQLEYLEEQIVNFEKIDFEYLEDIESTEEQQILKELIKRKAEG